MTMTDSNVYSEFETLKQENEKLKEGLLAIRKQLDGFQLMSESNGFLDQCSCSIFLLKNIRGILARSELANIKIEEDNITDTGADPSPFDDVLSSPSLRPTRKRSLANSPEISEGRKRLNTDEQLGSAGNSNNSNNNNSGASSSADLLMNPMDPFNFGSMDLSQPDRSGASHEVRQYRIQQCLQSFSHATQCNNSQCHYDSCQKMKLVIQHVKSCQRKTVQQFNCLICKNLVTICCFHAKNCQQSNCHLPFCATIKEKIRQKKQQHLQRVQNMMQMNSQSEQDSFMTASSSSSSVFSTVESEHVEIPHSNLPDDDSSHMSHLEGDLLESTEPNPSEPPTVKVEYFEQAEDSIDPLASIKYDNNTFYY